MPTIKDFIDYVRCGSTLSENLRAIDKYNLEHVWVGIRGVPFTRLYYWTDKEVLDSYPLDTVLTHVGAGCIAWDDSDWEFSTERPYETHDDVERVRRECRDAHEEYKHYYKED